jgi:predicted adenylyl cyclase CyaB
MREVELKAVVDDIARRRKQLEKAGASLSFEGKLRDARYDLASGDLARRDEVLRVRRYVSKSETRAELDWKGPTESEDVYKVREEISTVVDDFDALTRILQRLGFTLIREIDREIAQYDLAGATIRFETYPRMDDLVEVEGEPEAIENAIEALGIPRGTFTSDSLPMFVERFEQRTGVQAATSDREMTGNGGTNRSDR